MNRRMLLATWLLAVPVAAGCFRTEITIEGGSGTTALTHDATWHHGAVAGLVDFSSPHDLDQICPGGTVKTYSKTSFINGIVQGLTFSFYNPQEVTIVCVMGGGGEAASVEPSEGETLPDPPPAYEQPEGADEPPPPPPAEGG